MGIQRVVIEEARKVLDNPALEVLGYAPTDAVAVKLPDCGYTAYVKAEDAQTSGKGKSKGK